MERRSVPRSRTMFRPSCLHSEAGIDFVMMKNISEAGAKFAGTAEIREGDEIAYQWGNSPKTVAKVCWAADGQFGVEHATLQDVFNTSDPFAYRSVRLPVATPLTILGREDSIIGETLNVSQKGAQACIERDMRVGELVTVQLAGRLFEAATVKWSHAGKVGLEWNAALDCPSMTALIEAMQPWRDKSRPLFSRVVAA